MAEWLMGGSQVGQARGAIFGQQKRGRLPGVPEPMQQHIAEGNQPKVEDLRKGPSVGKAKTRSNQESREGMAGRGLGQEVVGTVAAPRLVGPPHGQVRHVWGQRC